MKLHRHVLSALVLSFALPLLAPGSVGTAAADNRKIYSDIQGSSSTYMTWNPRVVIPSGDGDDGVASVTAEMVS
ncbi:MAG: hypothetical protein Q7U06_01180, partial [Pseudomonadota bacterium]|nr:hypothetical protein [Pseudomonadota bacterium]